MNLPTVPGSDHPGEALSAWLDDELAPAARREVESHLARCGACREDLAVIASARAAVRGLAVHPCPAQLWSELTGDGTVVPFRRRAGWAVAAAAAAAAVALLLPQDRGVAPPLPSLVDSHAARASVTGDPLTQWAPIAVPARFEP